VIAWLKKLSLTQVIREDGPKKHLEKKGTPTMGGLMILAAFIVSVLLWARLDNLYIYIIIFCAVWFAGIGLIDDAMKLKVGTKGLSAGMKLILQFAGAAIITGIYIGFEAG
ncbi:MAG TPA: phospho-N-acetylmuramoyl-pentapeptide-transferase, partial [Candidatus Goldiibacteriota bacterium]|nr:phospho-N-acetylmuramoyl-pentapeptide-transferase [Candidatus Goldiibacteriota bacterium]